MPYLHTTAFSLARDLCRNVRSTFISLYLHMVITYEIGRKPAIADDIYPTQSNLAVLQREFK